MSSAKQTTPIKKRVKKEKVTADTPTTAAQVAKKQKKPKSEISA